MLALRWIERFSIIGDEYIFLYKTVGYIYFACVPGGAARFIGLRYHRGPFDPPCGQLSLWKAL